MKTIKGAAGLLLLGLTSAALAVEGRYNLPPAASQMAADLHTLHYVLLFLCLAIFISVFGVMFYSIWAHRKSKGAVSATFTDSHAVEITWTVIPFLIVVGIGAYATPLVVQQKDTTQADLTIKVTGYQWKWGYDYLKGEGEGIGFLSTLTTPQDQILNVSSKGENYLIEVDNELVVPVNKKVRLVLTANDVIHAWMIPAFGVKQDAIPGFVRDTWFKADKVGVYRGQCAELCGKDHAFMPIVVKVVSNEDYSKWVAEQKKLMQAKAEDPSKVWTLDELKQRGAQVYAANCVACHQANGKGLPPTFPALDGSKVVNGPFSDLVAMLLNGKGAMPAWKQLSDTELAAVSTYVRNNWGNATGDLLQPAAYLDARGGKMPEGGGKPVAKSADAAKPSAKVYFASGTTALSDEGKAELARLVAQIKDSKQKLEVSGFVDATGNADKNSELAKERARAVRDVLVASGVAETQIELKKPQSITGAADNREARRVEVRAAG